MDYDAVLAQVVTLLQQEQRVAYRVLKRRLQLDDEILEDLKDDLIYAPTSPPGAMSLGHAERDIPPRPAAGTSIPPLWNGSTSACVSG
jgi:hypothetical protein